jgi:hypothetical protein
MKKVTNEIDNTIIKIANNIINTWLLKSDTNGNKIDSIDIAETSSSPEERTLKRNFSEKKCVQCDFTPDQQEQSIYILQKEQQSSMRIGQATDQNIYLLSQSFLRLTKLQKITARRQN